MRSLVPLPLLLTVALAGCEVDREWEDLDLVRSEFSNAHLEPGQAWLEVHTLPGFACPDGLPPTVHVVVPSDGPLAPVALLLHDNVLDVVDPEGAHVDEGVDRLAMAAAQTEVEAVLGVRGDLPAGTDRGGAWVAALIESGYAVAAPTNCWGDLWHGRGVDNPQEGFARSGRLVLDAALLAARELEGVAPGGPLLVVGLGDGGRGVVEYALAGGAIDAAAIDSSPDRLPPVVTSDPHGIRARALRAVYYDELADIVNVDARDAQLIESLQRDSLLHLVSDEGFRAPLVYAWSPHDPNLGPTMASPGAEAVQSHYAAEDALLWEWDGAVHAPSNEQLPEAREALAFLRERLPAPAL